MLQISPFAPFVSTPPCIASGLTGTTGGPDRMSHRKWRETKQQPTRVRAGHQVSCCLVLLHFLCHIVSGDPVLGRHPATAALDTQNDALLCCCPTCASTKSLSVEGNTIFSPDRRQTMFVGDGDTMRAGPGIKAALLRIGRFHYFSSNGVCPA